MQPISDRRRNVQIHPLENRAHRITLRIIIRTITSEYLNSHSNLMKVLINSHSNCKLENHSRLEVEKGILKRYQNVYKNSLINVLIASTELQASDTVP